MKTALLVIDVQESFRQLDSWAEIDVPDIAERISPLVDRVRQQGGAVIWVLHTEPGSGTTFDPANGAVRLIEGLHPEPADRIIHKTSHNAFTTTNLAQQLQTLGVSDLLVTGIRTEQCCETTARVGSDLGYTVTFVLDATATHPLATHDGTVTLTPAQLKERTAAVLHRRFARVTTAAEVLAQA